MLFQTQSKYEVTLHIYDIDGLIYSDLLWLTETSHVAIYSNVQEKITGNKKSIFNRTFMLITIIIISYN